MTSEGSCDTEDWNNDAIDQINTALVRIRNFKNNSYQPQTFERNNF